MITPDPPPITVSELIEHLKQFDLNKEVIFEIYSDYNFLRLEDVRMVEAIVRGGYVERFYASQYKTEDEKREIRPKVKTYLCFPGN